MRKTIRCCVILLVLCLSLTGKALMQTDADPLYITTWNSNTRLSTLWRYDIGASQVEKVFTPTSQGSLQQLLSKQEFNLYKGGLEEYNRPDLMPKDWPNLPLTPTISAVWRLDESHLLIQTANDVRASMGADSLEVGLYGYHEFLILDLADPQKPVSILKFDYHNSAFIDDWYGFIIPFVNVGGVVVNPTHDKLAITLHSAGRFTTPVVSDSILIVDYSVSPVQTHLIPLASHPVWSSDGNHLAYIKGICLCNDKRLTSNGNRIILSLQINSFTDRNTRTIETYDAGDFNNTNVGVMSWVSDDTLVYTWFPDDYPRFDNCCITKSFNVNSHAFLNVSLDYPSNMVVLAKPSQNAVLVGIGDYNASDTAHPYFLPLSLNLLTLSPVANRISYNDRFSERVVFSSWNINTDHQPIKILDADQRTTSFELWKALPPDEWIVDIAT